MKTITKDQLDAIKHAIDLFETFELEAKKAVNTRTSCIYISRESSNYDYQMLYQEYSKHRSALENLINDSDNKE